MEERPLLLIYDQVTQERWERPLLEDTLLIGREESCGLTLADRQVSRRHATIYRDGERYYIRDEHSRNGTFLNGELLTSPRALADGDKIGIASRYRLTFVGSESTAPLYRAGPPSRGIYLDKAGHRVWVDGVEVVPPLSAAQYRLLSLLVERAGNICSRDDIVDVVWPEESIEGITDQAIDALVRRLRARLAEASPSCSYIETVRGHGFRLRQPE